MKKKNQFFLFVVIALLAVLPVMIIGCGERERQHRTEQLQIDSLRRANRALIERLREAQLKTLEDSIHYYEDGY